MRSKLLDQNAGRRTFVVVFETGEEASRGLLDFAREQRLEGSQLTAIGAFSDVTLGYWIGEGQGYGKNRLAEQVEVVSLLGNIALSPEGEPQVHAHVVVGRSDGSAWGGHLLEAHVRPTLEVVVMEQPGHLMRRFDPGTGLALLQAT